MMHSNTYAGRQGPAFFWTLACCIVLFLFYSNAQAQAQRLPVATLIIGTHPINAEIAATEPSRNYGLMHRQSLPTDTGMLFVFDTTGRPCFWMKNTPLPLTIAFIDRNGYIVNMADMQPYSEISHCPAAPVLYALEMEQGWFESKGIEAGTRVTNLPQPSNR